jgi:uncharacterized protein with GYD domain
MAMTLNPNAKKEHPDLTHQVDESMDAFAHNGVKVERIFATLGRYDYLVLFEAEDQSKAFKVASDINAMGLLETETWPVIPYEEYQELLQ